jgi:ADP-dependent NAD(P)H-hydrate dehydratase / NAD(P)H-hydrate epimerase
VDRASIKVHRLTGADVAASVPARPERAHKYSFGRLQILAGSARYPGAAFLCALGAFKSGCGYVSLDSQAPEKILAQIPEVVLGRDSKATALVVGPGLEALSSADEQELLRGEVPRVIDAMALASLKAKDLASLKNAVLTPHAGEAAALFGVSAEEIERDRVAFLSEQLAGAKLHPSSCLVLKGFETLIYAHEEIALVPTGNVAQANAGQGDLLSGVIGGLLAQGLDPSKAARLACFSLGLAADRLAAGRYPAGVLAHEVASELGVVWESLRH